MVLRNTRQRQLVMDAIMQSDEGVHLNADSIYHIVKQQQPKISLGTVYRNLDILCNMGIIVNIKYGHQAEYYDKIIRPHYHFCCEKCGELQDVDIEYNLELDVRLRKDGNEVRRHRLVFDGVCKKCNLSDSNLLKA